MTKTNAGLLRAARLLDLVPYLMSHQGIEIDVLAQQFEISKTELLEDLNTLWMCGLPGYTPLELMDLTFDSGFVTIRNADELQNARALNNEEVVALLLGLDYLKGQLLTESAALIAAIESLVSRLSSTLRIALTNNLSAHIEVSAHIRGALLNAIAKREPLEIQYHSPTRDEIILRTIHPLHISINQNIEYVDGFCELVNDYRTFRLDRILTTNPASSPGRWLESNVAQPNVKLPFEIAILERERDVCERLNIDLETLKTSNVKAIAVFGFSEDWLIREILTLGGSCILTKPADIRHRVKMRAELALNGYRNLLLGA